MLVAFAAAFYMSRTILVVDVAAAVTVVAAVALMSVLSFFLGLSGLTFCRLLPAWF